MASKTNGKTEQSTMGIRKLLFESIDQMKKGEMTPQELGRLSAACGQILASARLELEAAKFIADYDVPSGVIGPDSALRLTKQR